MMMMGYGIHIIDHINNPVVLEATILPSLWKTIELETIYNIIFSIGLVLLVLLEVVYKNFIILVDIM